MGSTSESTEVSSPDTGRAGAASADVTRPGANLASDGDRVLVGIVTRPHGIRGEVKIDVQSDVEGRFAPGRELFVVSEGLAARRVRIASSRRQRGGAVVRFEDCQSRDQAENLRGSRLEVSRSEVPVAPPGLYYHFDLIGCRCVDAEQGELGEVTAVLEDGGGDLLAVRRSEKTLLVPFVEAFLESVDIAGKQIRLRLPAGLIETCESKF